VLFFSPDALSVPPKIRVVRARFMLGLAVIGAILAAGTADASLPPPGFGHSVDIGLVSGTVIVTPPGGHSFKLGMQDRNIAVGSLIDTTHGRVDLRAAPPPAGDFAPHRKLPHKVLRLLWASGSGRFQTVGRYSAATVLGTKWLTEDFCDGTLVRVSRGVVAVENLATHAIVTVRAGHSAFTPAA
jgi:hypothetical protein